MKWKTKGKIQESRLTSSELLDLKGKLSIESEDFRGRDLSKFNKKGEKLFDLLFMTSDFSQVDFSESHFYEVRFNTSKLPGANFENARIVRSSFFRSDLSNANFDNALLKKTTFNYCNLTNVSFDNVDVSGINFALSILKGVLVTNAELASNNFFEANFSGADFSGVTFRKCKFKDAILTGGDFSGATFIDVDFRGAVFDGTDLTGANMKGAKNVFEGWDQNLLGLPAVFPDVVDRYKLSEKENKLRDYFIASIMETAHETFPGYTPTGVPKVRSFRYSEEFGDFAADTIMSFVYNLIEDEGITDFAEVRKRVDEYFEEEFGFGDVLTKF